MSDETIDYQARADMATHNAVCAERYGSLWQAVKDLKDTIQANNTVAHARFNSISNRMWIFVGSVAAAAVLLLLGGVGFLIQHLLTRGLH